MNVVIDTNVVVSAVLRDRDPEVVVRYVALTPGWQWCASPTILAEYRDVLHRPKFALSAAILDEWDTMFDTLVAVVDAPDDLPFPRDQKDAKFLTCALAIDAAYLISGDRDLDEAQKVLNTTICSVRQFKTFIIDKAP